ncbi:MAG: hypothetical protein AAGU32_04650 [Bacillota bacterium]
MEYMTAQQAGKLWGISIRQVQTLCARGSIQGAVRFSRAWAIPRDMIKPQDGRCKSAAAQTALPARVLEQGEASVSSGYWSCFRMLFRYFHPTAHCALPMKPFSSCL